MSLPSGLSAERARFYHQRMSEKEGHMPDKRGFFRTDFGQLLLAFGGIMVASFFGTLLAGAMILALVR